MHASQVTLNLISYKIISDSWGLVLFYFSSYNYKLIKHSKEKKHEKYTEEKDSLDFSIWIVIFLKTKKRRHLTINSSNELKWKN